jgi:RsiW-degrading membrane proteinase PrsW (M82 family)
MLVAAFISLIAAVVPTLIYVLLFYWADRFEREPRTLVWIAFIWGAIPAIIASMILEVVIGTPFVTPDDLFAVDVVEGVVVAPIVEEVVKALALLWLYFRRRSEFDGPLDGLIYGALVGFGFAMTENFLYFLGAFDEGGFFQLTIVIFLRAIIFGLNHAFYTSLTGIGLGFARLQRSRWARISWFVLGLVAAIAVHSLHNLGASLASLSLFGLGLSFIVAASGLGLLILAVMLSWQHERRCVRSELNGEIGTLLTEQEMDILTGRWRHPARKRAHKKRLALLAELALRSQRLRTLGLDHEPKAAEEIEKLRRELATTLPA